MRQFYLILQSLFGGIGITFALIAGLMLVNGIMNPAEFDLINIGWTFVASYVTFWMAWEVSPNRYRDRQCKKVEDPLELEIDPDFLVPIPPSVLPSEQEFVSEAFGEPWTEDKE